MTQVSNTPSPGLVEHVTNMALDASLTERFVECDCSEKAHELVKELLNRGLVAYKAIYSGEGLGTVRIGPKGEVAKRVEEGGVHKWKVLEVDGTVGYNTRPSLPEWTLVHTDTPSEG